MESVPAHGGGGVATLGDGEPEAEHDPQGREPEEQAPGTGGASSALQRLSETIRAEQAAGRLPSDADIARADAEAKAADAAFRRASEGLETGAVGNGFIRSWNAAVLEIQKANGSMSRQEQRMRLAGVITQALGDDSTSARHSVSEAMRGVAPSKIREIAQGLVAELAKPKHGVRNPLGVLAHRLKGAAS